MLLGIIHLLPHKKQIISLSVCIPVMCVCVCVCVCVCGARFESFSTIVFKNIFTLLWGILVLFGKRVHDQIIFLH